MEMDEIKKRVLEDVDPGLHRKKRREKRKNRLIAFLELFLVIAAVFLIFCICMGVSVVKGDSMYPALHDQDIVLYQRIGQEYQPGDIVVVQRPQGERFVKRIVALAGDTVSVQEGKLYVNGSEEQTSSLMGDTDAMEGGVEYPFRLKDKEVFLLGDNREVSEDSRSFGAVKLEDIKGKIIWYMGKP